MIWCRSMKILFCYINWISIWVDEFDEIWFNLTQEALISSICGPHSPFFPTSFCTTTAGLFSFYSPLSEMQAGDIAAPAEKATVLEICGMCMTAGLMSLSSEDSQRSAPLQKHFTKKHQPVCLGDRCQNNWNSSCNYTIVVPYYNPVHGRSSVHISYAMVFIMIVITLVSTQM